MSKLSLNRAASKVIFLTEHTTGNHPQQLILVQTSPKRLLENNLMHKDLVDVFILQHFVLITNDWLLLSAVTDSMLHRHSKTCHSLCSLVTCFVCSSLKSDFYLINKTFFGLFFRLAFDYRFGAGFTPA